VTDRLLELVQHLSARAPERRHRASARTARQCGGRGVPVVADRRLAKVGSGG
jgi:hypothetical protein